MCEVCQTRFIDMERILGRTDMVYRLLGMGLVYPNAMIVISINNYQ